MKYLINCLFLVSLMIGTNAFSQKLPVNTYSVASWWAPAAPAFSPVVNQDHSITFRVRAKQATSVELLFGEWFVKPVDMVKDTSGTWSMTIAPVEPGIYCYVFSVDGIQTLDMNNPVVKTGTQVYQSIVQVPGTPARFDELRDVPHGTLVNQRFYSMSLKKTRNVTIYLPHGYYTNPKRNYPLLVLRHGSGDDETSWTQKAGSADVILENLIAEHKAVPMIVVMPNGLTDGSWAGGSSPEAMRVLEEEMLHDILPMVESNYRIASGRNNRAIAGLSMGGGQAFVMGLRNLDKFAWIGEFSSGLLSDVHFKIDETLPNVMSANTMNSRLKLLWLACGTDDPRYPGQLILTNLLNRKGITNEFHETAGGHEWKVWRVELNGFMQKIFK
jgi:enterochelin esterase-like enzyme